MPHLLIKHKIGGGFAFLLILLAFNASISSYNLSNTSTTVNSLINESQPLVMYAHQFNVELSHASGALGNYLLTKNPEQKQRYQESLQQASVTLDTITQTEKVKQSETLTASINHLHSLFDRFRQYEERVLMLATSVLENEPAMKYASDVVNPNSMAFLGALSAMTASESEEELDESRKEWFELLHETRYNFQKLISAVRIYITQPAPTNKENMMFALERAGLQLKKFSAYEDLYTLDQEESVEITINAFETYLKNIDVLIDKSESNRRRIDVYLLNEEILPLLETIQNTVDTLVKKEASIMQQSGTQLLHEVNTGLSVQLMIAAIGIVLGILVALLIIHSVTGPLNKTVAALQEVAQGDGDLTRRIKVKSKDELGKLAEAFNQFSIKLQGLVSNISECSNQLAVSSQQMNQAASGNQADIRTQNSQLDQISQAIVSMEQQLHNVAEHTEQAAGLSEQAYQDSQDGKKIVNLSLQCSNQLASDVEQAASVINQLEADVVAISKVLNVIHDIAEQTNLLALNAAIEAARAGEQGRGFAVVADEVRTLASRTQEATGEIKTMIQRLQSGSQNAVETMKNGKDMADQGLDQSQQANASLEKIGTATDGMLNMNREIAKVSDNQRQAVHQVSKNVAAINDIAAKTMHGSNLMADSGQSVNELASQLQNLVSQFKI